MQSVTSDFVNALAGGEEFDQRRLHRYPSIGYFRPAEHCWVWSDGLLTFDAHNGQPKVRFRGEDGGDAELRESLVYFSRAQRGNRLFEQLEARVAHVSRARLDQWRRPAVAQDDDDAERRTHSFLYAPFYDDAAEMRRDYAQRFGPRTPDELRAELADFLTEEGAREAQRGCGLYYPMEFDEYAARLEAAGVGRTRFGVWVLEDDQHTRGVFESELGAAEALYAAVLKGAASSRSSPEGEVRTLAFSVSVGERNRCWRVRTTARRWYRFCYDNGCLEKDPAVATRRSLLELQWGDGHEPNHVVYPRQPDRRGPSFLDRLVVLRGIRRDASSSSTTDDDEGFESADEGSSDSDDDENYGTPAQYDVVRVASIGVAYQRTGAPLYVNGDVRLIPWMTNDANKNDERTSWVKHWVHNVYQDWWIKPYVEGLRDTYRRVGNNQDTRALVLAAALVLSSTPEKAAHDGHGTLQLRQILARLRAGGWVDYTTQVYGNFWPFVRTVDMQRHNVTNPREIYPPGAMNTWTQWEVREQAVHEGGCRMVGLRPGQLDDEQRLLRMVDASGDVYLLPLPYSALAKVSFRGDDRVELASVAVSVDDAGGGILHDENMRSLAFATVQRGSLHFRCRSFIIALPAPPAPPPLAHLVAGLRVLGDSHPTMLVRGNVYESRGYWCFFHSFFYAVERNRGRGALIAVVASNIPGGGFAVLFNVGLHKYLWSSNRPRTLTSWGEGQERLTDRVRELGQALGAGATTNPNKPARRDPRRAFFFNYATLRGRWASAPNIGVSLLDAEASTSAPDARYFAERRSAHPSLGERYRCIGDFEDDETIQAQAQPRGAPPPGRVRERFRRCVYGGGARLASEATTRRVRQRCWYCGAASSRVEPTTAALSVRSLHSVYKTAE